jgi:hypothetical protein
MPQLAVNMPVHSASYGVQFRQCSIADATPNRPRPAINSRRSPPGSFRLSCPPEESSSLIMQSLYALAAPVALLLPAMAETAGVPDDASRSPASAPQCDAVQAAQEPAEPVLINPLSALRQSGVVRQVRIEQRVVIRIAPQPPAARQDLLADLPQRETRPRFEERGKEKCVALAGIAGVQTGSGNRLVLYLRDRRMISVNLEKSCRARDFYSGFYVEKNKDGRLCVDRDKLQSRTGARCQVDTMRELVEVRG